MARPLCIAFLVLGLLGCPGETARSACHNAIGDCFFEQLHKTNRDDTGNDVCELLASECSGEKIDACGNTAAVSLPCTQVEYVIDRNDIWCVPNLYECFFYQTGSTTEGCNKYDECESSIADCNFDEAKLFLPCSF